VLGAAPAKLDVEKSLTQLGLDSLMAVELRNWIEGELRLSLPTVELMSGPTVVRLAELLLAQIEAPVLSAILRRRLAELSGLPDAELRGLLTTGTGAPAATDRRAEGAPSFRPWRTSGPRSPARRPPSLARQLIQEKFRQDFEGRGKIDFEAMHQWLGSEEGIMATPHSQRSAAEIRVRLTPSFEMFPIVELIDEIENALKTPVQATVKREDEQAFARLNGQNLMFCEDAGRRIQTALNTDERILDFWARCTHYESLHPHNAVAVVTKGVEGGYVAGAGAPVRLESPRS